MDYSIVLNEIKLHIEEFYRTHNDPRLVYHNLDHVKDVVDASTQIAEHYKLPAQEFFVLLSAAYFHDVGYFHSPSNHEQEGAKLASAFLIEKSVPAELILKVESLILSTKMPQQPKNNLEEILCDADLFHIGLKGFNKKAKALFAEMKQINSADFKQEEWKKKNILFLQNHQFHTKYARDLLENQKLKNVEKIKNRLQEKKIEKQKQVSKEKIARNQSTTEPIPLTQQNSTQKIFDLDKITKSKKNSVSKGVETLFRITSTNNQRLSDMADNKAHILITVNSIMLSLIVSLVLKSLDNNTFLIVPTFILLFVCLTCVVVSILSTRPAIPEGTFTKEQLNAKKVNLIFFGNFYKMSLQQYREGMIDVMNDLDFLYGTLITDVYSQGVVLGRKYKLIRLAYNIFMYGLIVSVLCFVLVYFWYGKI